jgi:hypothetical protein
VQLIYLAVPLVIVVASKLAQNLSKTFGRVQSILLVKAVGLTFLYVLVFFNDYLVSRPQLIVPIYLARTGLMNCTYPLQVRTRAPTERKRKGKGGSSSSLLRLAGANLIAPPS